MVAQLIWVLQGDAVDWAIRLGEASLEPEDGYHAAGIARDEPFVLQFYELPDASQIEALRARGVILDRYAGGGAYIVRCDGSCAPWLAADSSVRATVALSQAMKRSPVFDTDPALAARIQQGRPLELEVVFFEGTGFERAEEILQENAITLSRNSLGLRGSITIEATWQVAMQLLEYPELRWIDPALSEAIPATTDAGGRARVDQVREQPEFLMADGSGVRVGIWDWFPEQSHTDLENRVTWVNVVPGQSSHGQFISGIVAGAGLLDPRAKGMAPKAELYWHTCERGTAWSDMRAMKADHGITITSNSWGVKGGWWADPGAEAMSWESNEWVWGYYHELAAGADELVRSDDLLLVFAAGNARGYSHLGPHYHSASPPYDLLYHDVHPPNPQFTSVWGPAVAKNIVVVGAVSKDEVVTEFSSWGPTSDGRVRPDLVAAGLDIFITDADDGYTVASGTSLSAPVVSGTAALLSDYSSRRHGFVPTSLELKNLLIHSARDLGYPGPDYSYGHGLIDAELAARVLDAASFVPHTSHRTGGRRRNGTTQTSTRIVPPAAKQRKSADHIVSLMLSGELDQDEIHSFRFSVPHGSSQLRATLAWHDPPGEILVNDLDLWLGSPYGDLGRPFVLDPQNPTLAASRGRNEIDNVESVLVENPMPASWKVVVEGARVAMEPERYSLIVSASGGNQPLLLLPEGECEILGFYTTIDDEASQTIRPWSIFRTGDPLNMYLAFSVPENADYGNYFGSLTVGGSITNRFGEEVYRIAIGTHELSAVDFWEEVGSGPRIPEGLPVGSYTARLALRMHNGAECTSEYPFTVQ
jgi:subtilisin family serine protease